MPILAQNYIETEYLFSGSARGYTGPVGGPIDLESDGTRYVTRILVRYPAGPGDFSGRVIVEPFNTSFGEDRDALWARAGDLLQAEGDAWVGVTGRAMGAAVLHEFDPLRYTEIDFPSNDLAWDVLAALGALLKVGGAQSPLSRLDVRRVYLAGYSQSAVDVATFAVTFHSSARLSDGSAIYDGYSPAARAASCAAVASGGAWRPPMEYAQLRGVDVPVIEVQPQSDVEGFSVELGGGVFVNPGSSSVRRPDSDHRNDRYRLYEVAGAPHVAQLDGCAGAGSSFPTATFVRAAFRLLIEWVEEAVPAPRARRIVVDMDGPTSEALVDQSGNPLGGVRSPHLDVPLVRYSAHSGPGPMCELVGQQAPLPIGFLIARYGDATQYLSEFTAALDATIAAGFILSADRDQILSEAMTRAEAAFASADHEEAVAP